MTVPFSSPSSPSPCLIFKIRPSSQFGTNVQVPQCGISFSGHNGSLLPLPAPIRLHSKPSVPTISQALKHFSVTYMLLLASLSAPHGQPSSNLASTIHGLVSPTITSASTALTLPRPSKATRIKPAKACALLSANATRPRFPLSCLFHQLISLCCPSHPSNPMKCIFA